VRGVSLRTEAEQCEQQRGTSCERQRMEIELATDNSEASDLIDGSSIYSEKDIA